MALTLRTRSVVIDPRVSEEKFKHSKWHNEAVTGMPYTFQRREIGLIAVKTCSQYDVSIDVDSSYEFTFREL